MVWHEPGPLMSWERAASIHLGINCFAFWTHLGPLGLLDSRRVRVAITIMVAVLGSCWVVVLGHFQDFWHVTSNYFLALLGQSERYKGARSHGSVAHQHYLDVDKVRMA